jgi:hypothetical protein
LPAALEHALAVPADRGVTEMTALHLPLGSDVGVHLRVEPLRKLDGGSELIES